MNRSKHFVIMHILKSTLNLDKYDREMEWVHRLAPTSGSGLSVHDPIGLLIAVV
jgi:hypothetical protein